MNLAKISIEKSRITLLLLIAVIFIGIGVYSGLSRDSMPPFTVRVASVITEFSGASPERIEQLITDKIEKVAQELPELKEVSSTSRDGLSIVQVTLKDEVGPEDMQSVWDRFRRKINTIQGLPEGVSPFLEDDSIGEVYGIVVGAVSDGISYAEMKEYVDDIRDDLIRIPDAAKVVLGGVQEERVFIEFENARLREYGLSALKLQEAIATTNILSSGGEINLGDERIILEPTGNFENFDQIGNILVPVGDKGQELVRLRDITTIKKGYVDPSMQKVLINGKNAISMHINLKDNSNVITLGEEVDKVVAEWQERLPIGLELSRISSLDTYIDDKVDNFIGNLLQSIGIVLAVMLIFLGFRTGMIIASLIPIVTIMTLMLMGVLDMGLNQVTLAALIMALGMLVDNAIVVAETIMVKMDAGQSPKDAATNACSELFMPLLISTLTTSAAFLAFYMSPTNMGDIVGPIFVVISIALLSSWLVALTVITLFCCLLLQSKEQEGNKGWVDRVIGQLKVRYKDLILLALSHKRKVLAGITLAFVLAIFGFSMVPFLFFPDSDRNMITIDINLPSGTKIETTESVVQQLERYMIDSLQVSGKRSKGIVDWSAYVGQGPESYDLGYTQDEANSSYAHILVNTSSFEENARMIEKLDSYGFENFPNADIKVKALAAGAGGVPIEIKISGGSPDKLSRISSSIKEKLTSVSGTKNIKDDWGTKSKKFLVEIDQNRAMTSGVSSQDIATSLQTSLTGFQTGEFREKDKNIPIMMRSHAGQQQTLGSLETQNIYSQATGRSVPLAQVATIIPQWQYGNIKRYNLKKTITVSSQLAASGNAAEIIELLTPWLDEQKASWPSGYNYEYGGDAKATAENMGSVIKYLPLSGFIIVLLLIVQFNSFRKMTMVVLTIPLAVIGVVIGLLISREPFGFMPFLGVISLAGIVINNAIVLIDRIEIEQHEMHRKIQDAVIVACLQRFRPILLATFTTVLGLIPLYVSGGELWEGMAISIMVGLLFGTVITLVFIPAFFSTLYKVDYRGYSFDKTLLRE